jgi:hypothetical protein
MHLSRSRGWRLILPSGSTSSVPVANGQRLPFTTQPARCRAARATAGRGVNTRPAVFETKEAERLPGKAGQARS